MKIQYTLSNAAVEREYIATGKRDLSSRCLIVEDTDLTPQQRELLVCAGSLFGTVTLGEYHVTPKPLASPSAFPQMPRLQVKLTRFDSVLTFDEVFAYLADMCAKKQQALAEIERRMPDYEAALAEQRAREAAIAAAREEARLASIQARHEARIRATIIDWKADDTAIVNLFDAVLAASELEVGSRIRPWVKEVTGVDRTKPNGYCFEGSFISNGTVEISKGKRLYLVAATTGSRRHPVTDYAVVILDSQGVLSLTDIHTNDIEPGWSLRIRDQVAELLR